MWHDNSSKRPDIERVLQEIKPLSLECTILDEEGLEFWKQRSPDSYEIAYDDFIIDFHDKYLKRQYLMLTDYYILRLIFCEHGFDGKVSIESFNNAFNWFGPMRINGKDIVQRILDLCENEWFQGDITRTEAEGILNQKFDLANSNDNLLPYLVRLSLPTEKDTSVHPATISYYSLKIERNKETKKREKNIVVEHLKIEKEGLVYKTNFKKERENYNLEGEDLQSIVDQVQNILELSPLTAEGKPISKYLQIKERHDPNNPQKRNRAYVNILHT